MSLSHLNVCMKILPDWHHSEHHLVPSWCLHEGHGDSIAFSFSSNHSQATNRSWFWQKTPAGAVCKPAPGCGRLPAWTAIHHPIVGCWTPSGEIWWEDLIYFPHVLHQNTNYEPGNFHKAFEYSVGGGGGQVQFIRVWTTFCRTTTGPNTSNETLLQTARSWLTTLPPNEPG